MLLMPQTAAQAKPNGTTGPSMGRVGSKAAAETGLDKTCQAGQKAEGSAQLPRRPGR